MFVYGDTRSTKKQKGRLVRPFCFLTNSTLELNMLGALHRIGFTFERKPSGSLFPSGERKILPQGANFPSFCFGETDLVVELARALRFVSTSIPNTLRSYFCSCANTGAPTWKSKSLLVRRKVWVYSPLANLRRFHHSLPRNVLYNKKHRHS